MYNRSCSGVSPIIATILLCTVALAAVAVMYPIVASAFNQPTYAASISQVNLLKQDDYVLMTTNVKNTGSGEIRIYCVIMDDSLNEYSCGPTQYLAPGQSTAFVYESDSNGDAFLVGVSYRIRVYDTNNGLLNEVSIFCGGR